MGLTSITWMEDCRINSIIGMLLKDLQARIRASENSAIRSFDLQCGLLAPIAPATQS